MAATTGQQPADRSLDTGAHGLLRCRRVAARQLPAPDEEWYRRDVPDELATTIEAFRAKGIIKVVSEDLIDGRSYAYRYRTTAAAYAYVQNLSEPDVGCAHTGVHTLDADAGLYTCTREACDQTFDRAVAERRLSR